MKIKLKRVYLNIIMIIAAIYNLLFASLRWVQKHIDGFFLKDVAGIKKIQRIRCNSYHGLARYLLFLLVEAPSSSRPWYFNLIVNIVFIFRLYLLKMKMLDIHDILMCVTMLMIPKIAFSSDEHILVASIFPYLISLAVHFFMVPWKYQLFIYFVNALSVYQLENAAMEIFSSNNDSLKKLIIQNLYGGIYVFLVSQFIAFSVCRLQFNGIVRNQKMLLKDLKAANLQLSDSNKKYEESLKLLEETNKELELSKKQLEEALKAKDILATVSHELRNPLNSLMGNIELLLDEITDKEQREKLQVAKICGDVLLCLINNLLDAAKIASDKIEVSLIPVNMFQFWEKVWRINSVIIHKKNLSGQFYISNNFPKYLTVDSQRILQILMNLISNAVKFTDKGFIKIMISWVSNNGFDFIDSRNGPNISDSMKTSISTRNSKSHHKTYGSSKISQDHFRFETEPIIFHKKSDNKVQATTSTNAYTSDSEEINDENNENNFFRANTIQPSKTLTPKFIKDVLTEKYHFFHSDSLNISEDLDKKAFRSLSLQPISNLETGFIRIEIIDSGCGIAKEAQHRLFTPFTQEDATITRKYGGTGLGLYIIKNLIDKMKGEISFTSQKNMGATFVVQIPSQVTDHGKEEQQKRQINSQLRKPEHSLKTYPGCMAMVVEDNHYNQAIFKSFLQKLRVEMHICDNGEQAYNLYRSKPPGYFSFITMDLQMPKMDGIKASKAIRDYEKSALIVNPVPIIIVTGNCSEFEKDACMNLRGEIRASFFFRKPLSFADCSHFVSVVMNNKNNDQTLELRVKKNLHFLVVDDDHLSLNLLCQYLKNNMIEFDIATNGPEAFEKIRADWKRYDGVLMDCEMPVMNGIEATERMKTFLRQEKRRDIPIYGMTGHTDAEHDARFKEAGMNRVFHKPINFAELISFLLDSHQL